jgi:hypothetical protein
MFADLRLAPASTSAAVPAATGAAEPAGATLSGANQPRATPPGADPDRTAFEIGWDFAHYRLVPPADHLHPGHPVRQGWEAGQAVFGARTLQARPGVRKWLQLRLNAWLRGKAFDSHTVTPHLLRVIDVPVCPITGEALTQGTGGLSDASVDRVNNDAGYAAGNLAVMSVRANRAKADRDWRDAAACARRLEAEGLDAIDGLTAAHWARLASLMSLCTPLPHAAAASLPLLVLPPVRLRVLNPVQALQVVLTLRFCQPGQMPRIDALVALCPPDVRGPLHSLLTTLLARRIAAGPGADAATLRRAMEAAWAQPLVLRRWQRVALRLVPAECERIVAFAVRRQLAGAALRCQSLKSATDGWALETGGRVELPAHEPVAEASRLPLAGRVARNRAVVRPPMREVQPSLGF